MSSADNALKLAFEKSTDVPVRLLELDFDNPRLETGIPSNPKNEKDVIELLIDIAALDELITSICNNKYLNLEPMIVIGSSDDGPFKVLEGNRRLAAIKIIRNRDLATELDVRVPAHINPEVIESTNMVLCYRVKSPEDARAFIGFKHINGPQRWDAFAKARYVTDWYKKKAGKLSIPEIAAKMGDTNETMQSYIYSMLILEQAEKAKLWDIRDRANPGRFAFSHLYTALGRKEYQQFIGLAGEWSDKPPMKPVAANKESNLEEMLRFIYGSRSANADALVESQNPDLKELGAALTNKEARAVLRNGGTLDDAREAMKSAGVAFQDAIIACKLRLKKAVDLIPKYDGRDKEINAGVDEVYEQADTLHTMVRKKKGYVDAAK